MTRRLSPAAQRETILVEGPPWDMRVADDPMGVFVAEDIPVVTVVNGMSFLTESTRLACTIDYDRPIQGIISNRVGRGERGRAHRRKLKNEKAQAEKAYNRAERRGELRDRLAHSIGNPCRMYFRGD